MRNKGHQRPMIIFLERYKGKEVHEVSVICSQVTKKLQRKILQKGEVKFAITSQITLLLFLSSLKCLLIGPYLVCIDLTNPQVTGCLVLANAPGAEGFSMTLSYCYS